LYFVASVSRKAALFAALPAHFPNTGFHTLMRVLMAATTSSVNNFPVFLSIAQLIIAL
jgi:hypothetical protein